MCLLRLWQVEHFLTFQEQFDLLPVFPERIKSPAQPVRLLFGITAHCFTQMAQVQIGCDQELKGEPQ